MARLCEGRVAIVTGAGRGDSVVINNGRCTLAS